MPSINNVLPEVTRRPSAAVYSAVLTTSAALFLACRMAFAIQQHQQQQTQPVKGVVYGIFPYHFSESTGPNQAIRFAGQEKDIQFDTVWSNPLAFRSLYALKWNVLYPNTSGGKITFRGAYDKPTGNFVLQDWHLRVPFQRIVVADEAEPENQKVVIAPHLQRSDFETSPEFDPLSARFKPRLHEIGR